MQKPIVCGVAHMAMLTTQEVPAWEWGTGCLEPGRPAEVTRLARACNDAALLAVEALAMEERSSEMLDRTIAGPLMTVAHTWSKAAVRYFDAMVAAHAGIAACFAAEVAITTSVLLTGGDGRHAAVPSPSMILSDAGRWLPLVAIPAEPPAGLRPMSGWAKQRAEAHAAEHAEVRRALGCFLLDGEVAVLDDPAALVDRSDTLSMIPAWDLAFALHRYAAGLHWTCACLTRDRS